MNTKKQRVSKKVYAVYKGDEFIVVGSAKECAEYIGITVHHLYQIQFTPNNRWDVIKVEI